MYEHSPKIPKSPDFKDAAPYAGQKEALRNQPNRGIVLVESIRRPIF